MECPNCQQETAAGKFCMRCGTPLVETYAAAAETNTSDTSGQSHDKQKLTSDVIENMKTTGVQFSHFFTNLVKRPNAAKNVDAQDMVSGIISVTLFSVIFAIGYFLLLKSFIKTMNDIGSMAGGFFGGMFGEMINADVSVSFLDGFLWPFVKMIMMIAIVVGLTFAVLKIANSAYTVQTTIAKYGAYLIPFGLLLAAGILLSLMGLGAVGVVAIIVSLFGTLFFIPMFVTMENKLSGIDHIYLLVLLHIVNCFVFAFVLRSLFAPFMRGLNDMLF